MAVIEFLDSRKVSLGTTATIELLDSKKVSLSPSVAAEIKLLDSRILALTPSSGNGGNGGPECSVNNDCPSGYICVNNVCVPEGNGGNGGGEEKEFPWIPAALVAAGGLILLAATGKEKPKP